MWYDVCRYLHVLEVHVLAIVREEVGAQGLRIEE